MKRNRLYNRDHPHRESSESRKKSNRKYRISSYGLTQELFDLLLGAQHNACGMCHEPFDEGQLIHVDHDHVCCQGPTSEGPVVRTAAADWRCRAARTMNVAPMQTACRDQPLATLTRFREPDQRKRESVKRRREVCALICGPGSCWGISLGPVPVRIGCRGVRGWRPV
jgi:Recombination endonuclease VII